MATDANYWKQQIADYNKAFEKWETRTKRIVRRYTDAERLQSTSAKGSKFNILWSNVQTLRPAVFSRIPQPDVSRRFKDSDPVGRVASMILERALDYEVSYYPDYKSSLENCIFDRLLGGRGVVWLRYEPKFKALESGENPDGLLITEDQGVEKEPESAEYIGAQGQAIDYECAPVDYVHWKDFGHSIARTWEEVTAVWRRVYMSRDALVERFGEEMGKRIPLDTMPEELKKDGVAMTGEDHYQATVYEIWDKSQGKVFWFSKGLTEIIDEKDDPYGLEGFFPCPKPLYGTLTTDDLIPTPDFSLYQDQAEALDVLADRISGLIDAIKVRGVYDAAVPELARLLSEGSNNILIPVNNWLNFVEKNGLAGAFNLVDIQPFAIALAECYKAFEQQKQQIYDLTGLSDILRGQSDPRETLGAQELKGQFGSMRLRARQDDVSRFATDILKIKAEMICKHYQPETIKMISGADYIGQHDLPLVEPAIQLLKSEPMRAYRIDIAADSLVQVNEQQEKQDRIEFMGAVSDFLEKTTPIVQASPDTGSIVLEMLRFGVGGFKVGKSLEGLFDQLIEKAKEAEANPQPEKPSPEEMKIQAEQQKAAMLAQNDMQKHQAEMQMRQTEQQNQAVIQQQENEAQQQRDSQKAQLDMAERQHETELKIQFEMQKLEFEKYKFQEELRLKQMMHEADRQDRKAEAKENADI